MHKKNIFKVKINLFKKILNLILLLFCNSIIAQDYADSLDYYKKKNEINKALKYGLKVKNQLELKNKNNDLYYADFLINIGKIYSSQFRNAEAEKYFIEGIYILKDSLGENNLEYASKLYDFAFIYSFSEFSFKAEPLMLKSLKIRKEILGENSFDYLKSLEQIGNYYFNTNNYKKSEPYLIEAIERIKTIYGNGSDKLDSLLYNLAFIYEKQNNFKKAEKLWLEFIDLKRKSFKSNLVLKKSILFLDDYLSFVGNFYFKFNDFDQAEKYFLEAINYRISKTGKDGKYTFLLGKLANLYLKINRFYDAEKSYNEILTLRKIGKTKNNYFGDNLYVCLLATTYLNQGDIKKANKKFKLSVNNFQYQLLNSIDEFSTTSNYNVFLKPNFYQSNYSLSFLHLFRNKDLKINIGCFENQLLLKNLSFRNQQRINRSIKNNGDENFQEKFNQYIINKKEINKFLEVPKEKRPSNLWLLKVKTEQLEKDLAKQSSLFSKAKKSLSINWKKIQEKLQPNEIAIDLVAYNYYNKKWTDSILYSAFVVGKGFKAPKYIPLFEKKQLEFLLAKNKNEKDNNRINRQYSDKAISDLFLKPMAKELENVTTIYLSPSGLGNQIDFSALPFSATQTLGEKHKVHILGSTAEMLTYKVAYLDQKSNLEFLLYGNIDYNKSAATNKVNSDTLTNTNSEFIALTSRSSTTTKFEYLAGSKIEINKINDFAKQNNFTSTIIDDKIATEESIKHLDGRITPYVLHLATHGFFFPDPKQELPKEDLLSDNKSKIFKTADDPMMRSGLLFAGANKY